MPKRKPMTQIEELRSIGLTDEEIRRVILNGGHAPDGHAAPPTAGTPTMTADKRMDQANLGPDPEVIRRHQEAVARMPKAVLEETFEVTLEKRHVDYVRQYAAFVSAKRPNSDPITVEKAIELIVRAYRVVDPDRPIWEGARGRTAPAALPPGTWAQKTA